MKAAQKLTEAIQREAPADPSTWGLAIERIKTANHVLISPLDAPQGGITVRHVKARLGDVRIEGVRAGGRGKY